MTETLEMEPIYITATPPQDSGMTEMFLLMAGIAALVLVLGLVLHSVKRRRDREALKAFERQQAALREEYRGGFTPPTRVSKVSPARFERSSSSKSSTPASNDASSYDPVPFIYDSGHSGYDGGSYGSDSGSSDCGSSDGGGGGDCGGGGD